MAILWQLSGLARDRGLSTESLTQATGLPIALIEGWLQQTFMPPLTAHELDRLCQALNCQPGDLLMADASDPAPDCGGEQTCLDSLLDAKLHIFHEEMNEHLTRLQILGNEGTAEIDPVGFSA